MKLELALFKTIIENTPLISVDLVIINKQGQVLLGQRQNRPAKDFWFVPGGRIYKDETFRNAFSRLTAEELNLDVSLEQGLFLGVFEHFYNDNITGTDFSTHYVVHGYQLNIEVDEQHQFPDSQHRVFKWFEPEELFASNDVHQYTKNYFLPR
ncbi:GDP-mannose mannosyl hydrolase [Citrobacter koseri]|uniref:GDP-mannose mannosyl hydrolase n=1 Tax=Citrobacter TaxID=544 RepID=UPI000E1412BE|nr:MULTISPECIES: GDP-mannose mannosyl hydrolase [Citrobacter]MBJ8671103.1 GDP-mannose mannosyl hydrolase [Citrobacter koseri]MBJ8763979.1 GDP-mannose mannosyl hydrolase [Citrobacter koseri]MBJ9119878.1 GDP-mannose mannosyl hydrolase [Citrobacter koseri]MBJ9228774.1 GDP-mannose mannosyl hydrolase [Citrobacter koseri]MDM3003065.1 GDP-mannose mannosyl hydrolase [Citrobacter sp. CK188]